MSESTETKTDFGTAALTAAEQQVPLLTVVQHPDHSLVGQRLVLPQRQQLLIGRKSTAGPPGLFEHTLISRRHAAIDHQSGQWSLRDLGSHNGCLVNGQRIEQCSLQTGDVIFIGPVGLLVHHGLARRRQVRKSSLLGIGSAHEELLEQIELVASRPVTVLIAGQSGVGKELVARELHRLSGCTGQFVAVNCGAIADGVVHSELFGHLRGAFSGADAARDGLIEAAQDGTLMLDEIGDASAALQVSLLRLLEAREYRRVGEDQPRCTTARFVAATHVPLEDAVAKGSFRQDLYGRISRWVIAVAPLRERLEDVLPLAHHFAAELVGRPVVLSRTLACALLRYHWPRNVRELQAVVEQLVVQAGAKPERLELSDRVARLLQDDRDNSVAADANVVYQQAPRRTSRPTPEQLEEQLAELGGNIKALAQRLNIGRNTLYRWLKDAGLDPSSFR